VQRCGLAELAVRWTRIWESGPRSVGGVGRRCIRLLQIVEKSSTLAGNPLPSTGRTKPRGCSNQPSRDGQSLDPFEHAKNGRLTWPLARAALQWRADRSDSACPQAIHDFCQAGARALKSVESPSTAPNWQCQTQTDRRDQKNQWCSSLSAPKFSLENPSHTAESVTQQMALASLLGRPTLDAAPQRVHHAPAQATGPSHPLLLSLQCSPNNHRRSPATTGDPPDSAHAHTSDRSPSHTPQSVVNKLHHLQTPQKTYLRKSCMSSRAFVKLNTATNSGTQPWTSISQ